MHTTHSPSFLVLHQNVGLWNASNSGKSVIIGVFDTGIAPQHPSFNDNGMPSPPVKWKGRCEFNVTTYCNKKIIEQGILLSRISPRGTKMDTEHILQAQLRRTF
ncbi:hypothetical protein FXO38_16177 [Capsicum annuum]|nr:hypothetical protein FXO38_16177 [Capsicum annuum]